jgi:excisionase family DNA binding protein
MIDKPVTDEPIYVRIRDAVARTGISRATLYRLAGAKLIDFIKVGRTTLVDWSSLKAYLTAQPTANIRNDIGTDSGSYHAAT